ncbi:hypothetical protein NNJEOMEG_01127 [Fundidesulfovibrio magnetotacticus]|uniref:Uncharacterized protein n=1 Tax=Fundidesulfovibrio magnetotacticus TaxID=2730080 RepID=A0A6V8LU13_9BACT|nr:hypothetical protein [Fundidesulfovibrio magnetotacticus]GFK93296.1 hypothetical protein NNJEOMEG_01127 [Fundidesulfovibrio magnetotacticus]
MPKLVKLESLRIKAEKRATSRVDWAKVDGDQAAELLLAGPRKLDPLPILATLPQKPSGAKPE